MLTTYRIGVSIGKTYDDENKKRFGAKKEQKQQTKLNEDDDRAMSLEIMSSLEKGISYHLSLV